MKNAVQNFRVVARFPDGFVALVALAATRAEAVATAWKRMEEAPPGTARMVVEEWEGGNRMGVWVATRTPAGELPVFGRAR